MEGLTVFVTRAAVHLEELLAIMSLVRDVGEGQEHIKRLLEDLFDSLQAPWHPHTSSGSSTWGNRDALSGMGRCLAATDKSEQEAPRHACTCLLSASLALCVLSVECHHGVAVRLTGVVPLLT